MKRTWTERPAPLTCTHAPTDQPTREKTQGQGSPKTAEATTSNPAPRRTRFTGTFPQRPFPAALPWTHHAHCENLPADAASRHGVACRCRVLLLRQGTAGHRASASHLGVTSQIHAMRAQGQYSREPAGTSTPFPWTMTPHAMSPAQKIARTRFTKRPPERSI